MTKYRTAPDPAATGWPKGVPYIIGNEGCERFSYYGMRSILQVHLTALYAATGLVQLDAELSAQSTVHLFFAGVYAFPMIGAIVADRLLGKYNTILWLSLVYCAGHAVLAFGENSLAGMYLGLSLIAIGSGGIKPCVSANVGDQFGKGNWHLIERVFQMFYFIINFGSFFATLLIPWTKQRFGTSVAFGIPGILMFLATIIFWAGRNRFVHVPPKPGGRLGLLDAGSSILLFMTAGSLFFTATLDWWWQVAVGIGCFAAGMVLFGIRQRIHQDDGFLAVFWHAVRALFTTQQRSNASHSLTNLKEHWFWGSAVRKFGADVTEGPIAVLRIISVFLLVSVFWALFDQHASSWIRQAEAMNRHVTLPLIGSFELLSSQIQAANPLLVMLLIPFASMVVYPGLEKLGFPLTPLRRMTIGMAVASLSFVIVALLQTRMDELALDGQKLHVGWQLSAYLVITLAEVMVSVTGLEFAYTQAPKRMKSTIMGFWLLTVTLGNVLVSFLSGFKSLSLTNFFWVFAALMAAAALLFGIRARYYVPRDYSQ